MSFSVEWSKAATKQLLSIPKKQRLIILSWVQEHLDGCEDRKAVIEVVRVGHRQGVYKNMPRL